MYHNFLIYSWINLFLINKVVDAYVNFDIHVVRNNAKNYAQFRNSINRYTKLRNEASDFKIVEETEPKASTRIGSSPIFAIANDDTSVTTWQTLVVFTHYVVSLFSIQQVVSNLHIHSIIAAINLIMTIGASVVIGDLATGIFHWSVDNYGSIKTPIFGSVCAAFQGHHSTPWTITFRPFANNVFKIAYATVPALLLLMLSKPLPLIQLFFTLFINWWLISQEFHKYSHMQMKNIPPLMKFLQDKNIILSRKEHGLHHNSPFEGHYCILTGVCNSFLDKTHFFRHLERIVYKTLGNKPITWKEDPNLETVAMSL
eukprot:gene6762-9264_t